MILPVEWDGQVVALAALIGLMIGSFMNVVIHRLPLMMERQWAEEMTQAYGAATAPLDTPPAMPAPPFNLMVPKSRCACCGHAIRWYENIPVASYLVLRGKCSACDSAISLRYPAVELVGALLGAYCSARWGASMTSVAWFGFAVSLLALALIDWDTTLLPDDLTLPLLWAGLIASSLGWTGVSPSDALWGATGGYLSLWLVYWSFKLITGKEGMGYGDFKLLSALGAWFGWQALVPLILMASVVGAVVGIAMKLRNNLREGGYIPFGPFLAGAGLAAMVLGPQALLSVFGLSAAP